jgi:protein gp37
MSANSKIEWTTHTFNAWWGCVEDGPECDHCYARSFAKRTGHDVWGLGERRFFADKHWDDLPKWDREAQAAGERHRVFCGSMMDIGECRSDEVGDRMDAERRKLWEIIERTHALDYLLLTKRPQNLPRVVPARWLESMPPNVWLGTTAGTRAGWEKRVKYLRKLSPVVRFVSVEPQLECLDVLGRDLAGIHWVIQGGESGGGSRPFDLAWARLLRDQCEDAGVAYFFKQAGDRPVDSQRIDGTFSPHDKRSIAAAAALGKLAGSTPPNLVLLRTKKGGNLAELRDRWPRQFPSTSAAPREMGVGGE